MAAAGTDHWIDPETCIADILAGCCGSGSGPVPCDCPDPVEFPTLSGTIQVINPANCNGLPDASFDLVYQSFGGHTGWLVTGGFYDKLYMFTCEGGFGIIDFTEQQCVGDPPLTTEDCSDGLYLEFENISDPDDPDLGQCCFGGGGLRFIVTTP